MENKQLTFNDLEGKVNEWAEERNLFEDANPIKQLEKTQEELNETRDAYVEWMTLNANNFDPQPEGKVKIQDGIGDVLVTLIIFSKMVGLDCVESLQVAYDEIKDRKGKKINGKFVKESDLMKE